MTKEEALKLWLPVIKMGVESMPECSEALDMAIEALEQKPKSEWQHDHEILKAYSNGANDVLDKIREEISEQSRMHMDGDLYIKTSECMQIIGRYKAEGSEE